ncbi:MAG TPA: SDR family NAD(P)-dependent oxidoreductase [Candidatus Cybelea sp.]|nr:SDR family NAD(P)-dependent oxidoreductase [Candidatus Cybelea sp.]
MARQFRSVLITGASSGIGAALAEAFAAPGVRLVLGGRSLERLAAIGDACRARGAAVESAAVDVVDRAAVAEWITAADKRQALDLVIANAGVSGGTLKGTEDEAQARRIFAINVDGVLNTVFPILPAMQERGSGQIGLMSSLAAYRGFPGAPAYGASKAAVRLWGEALRGDLAPRGIGVSVIMPGFIKSPMTDANNFPMPFLMPAERAARIVKRGLEGNRARIAFPWQTAFLAWFIGMLSPALVDPLLMRLPKKG